MERAPFLLIDRIKKAVKLFHCIFSIIIFYVPYVSAETTLDPRNVDAWCARVDKPSSIVICSDDELRVQAMMRNQVFAALKTRLSPEEYRALLDNQTRWVNIYSARCGISKDKPIPTPIPPTVIGCFRIEGASRLSYLQHYKASG